MNNEHVLQLVKDYLKEKNYLAACLTLKNIEMDDIDKYELTGEVAKYVVSDLAAEKNREKILYLRSVLVWLFKDVPGLASVYREQLRMASGTPNPVRDFMRGVQTFSDLATGGKSVDVEEAVDGMSEALKPEAIQEKVKDFFSQAGVDIDEGIKRATDFFEAFGTGRKTGEDSDPRDVSDEPKKPEGE